MKIRFTHKFRLMSWVKANAQLIYLRTVPLSLTNTYTFNFLILRFGSLKVA
jgi:hypothetical protein